MDMSAAVARMMAPLARRIRLMVGRAVITMINDGMKVQTAQVKLLDGEVREGVEVLMQYGHSSLPPSGEGLFFAVGGDRDHGVMICVADRSSRFKNLQPGDSVLYDNRGQSIHLTEQGIVIKCAGLPVVLQDAPSVRFETDLFEVTGDIVDRCDTAEARSMSDMRTVFNGHDHPGDSGGTTGDPNQAM